MAYESALYEKKGPIAYITINRPERMNALHAPANAELSEIWNDFDEDPAMWIAIRLGDRLGLGLCLGRPVCTECMGSDLAWEKASGRATVFTFGVMHQFYHPGFTNELPYNVEIVELEEGPRVNTNLVNIANEDIKVGMKVKATFVDQGGGVFIPKFEPA